MNGITPENPGNELASFLEKKSRRVWERLGASFLEKISISQHFNYFYELFEKMDFWEMSKRHSWKINPDLKSCLDIFSRNDAPRRSQTRLDFFPKMTLAQFPVFRE